MKVTVLGAGAYGLALALNFNKNNHEVVVWTKFEEEMNDIVKNRENKTALPGIKIPDEILITTKLENIKDSELVVFAVPAKFIRSTSLEVKDYLSSETHFLIASKGIEENTGLFLHEVIEDILDTKLLAVLSGPTFASDLAKFYPVGLNIASQSLEVCQTVRKTLESNNISLIETTDVVGTEICGFLKNVMAIASGILDGMNVSLSTKALFYTKALQDIKNFIISFGGCENTILSLAGVGDFILTCTSSNSRNYSFGRSFSQENRDEVIDKFKGKTVEGYYILEATYQLMKNKQLSLPIVEVIYNIVILDKEKEELLTALVL